MVVVAGHVLHVFKSRWKFIRFSDIKLKHNISLYNRILIEFVYPNNVNSPISFIFNFWSRDMSRDHH